MPSQAKPNVNTVWASGGLATPVDSAKQALGFIAEIPDYDTFNGMIQQISAFQKHTNQEGIPVHDLNTPYFTNAFVKGNGTIYIALQDSTGQALPAAGLRNAYWADWLPTSRFAGLVGAARNVRMSIPAASATATLTADEIVVETLLGGTRYCLPGFNKPINLATNGVGGMDTGAAPASGYVGIYAIYNPVTGVSGLLAVNATATAAPEICAGVMPAGYTASALVSVMRVTAGQLFGFAEQTGRLVNHGSVATLGTAALQPTYVALSIAGSIPKNAKTMSGVLGIGSVTASATSSMALAADTAGSGEIQAGLANAPASLVMYTPFSNLVVTTQQTLYYKLTCSGTILNGNIYTTGFTF